MVDSKLSNARSTFKWLQEVGMSLASADSVDNQFSSLRTLLVEHGYSLKDLDAEGQSTDAEMEQRFALAQCSAYKLTALKAYEHLKTTSSFYSSVADILKTGGEIRELLTKSGDTLLVLDDTGKRTFPEMESVFKSEVESAALRGLRLRFQDFEANPHVYIVEEGKAEKEIKRFTDEAALINKTLSIVVDDAAVTDDDVKARIVSAIRRESLVKARQEFESLEKGSEGNHTAFTIQYSQENVIGHLRQAQQPFSALDESGRSSDEQMRERVEKAVSNAYVSVAKKCLKNLLEPDKFMTVGDLSRKTEELFEHIQKAGVTIKALDETGERSDQQMQDYLESVVREAHIKQARVSLEDLKHPDGYMSTAQIDSLAKKIAEYLDAVEASFSSLSDDPAFTDDAMREYVHGVARKAHLYSAQLKFQAFEFQLPQRDVSMLQDLVALTEDHLKKSGEPLSRLLRFGTANDEEIALRFTQNPDYIELIETTRQREIDTFTQGTDAPIKAGKLQLGKRGAAKPFNAKVKTDKTLGGIMLDDILKKEPMGGRRFEGIMGRGRFYERIDDFGWEKASLSIPFNEKLESKTIIKSLPPDFEETFKKFKGLTKLKSST